MLDVRECFLSTFKWSDFLCVVQWASVWLFPGVAENGQAAHALHINERLDQQNTCCSRWRRHALIWNKLWALIGLRRMRGRKAVSLMLMYWVHYIYSWFQYSLCAFFFFFNCVHAVLLTHLKFISLGSVQSVFCMQFELWEYVTDIYFQSIMITSLLLCGGWDKGILTDWRESFEAQDPRQCCSTLMPLAVNYVEQFEGSWLQIQIDGNDARCWLLGACPQAVLTHFSYALRQLPNSPKRISSSLITTLVYGWMIFRKVFFAGSGL